MLIIMKSTGAKWYVCFDSEFVLGHLEGLERRLLKYAAFNGCLRGTFFRNIVYIIFRRVNNAALCTSDFLKHYRFFFSQAYHFLSH